MTGHRAVAGSQAARVEELVRVLEGLVGGRPVALFDWPAYANAGDHFIWLGEKVIFKHRQGCPVLYECAMHQLDFLQVTRLPPETVLVMQGGGNFGDLYSRHRRLREAVIAAFPDRRIMTMPQTVMFRSRDRLKRSARGMGLHPDLHVMARDHGSLATLAAQMGLRHCQLHIDTAFALQPIVRSLVAAMGAAPEREVVRLLRRDVEACRSPVADATSLDWAATDDLGGYEGMIPPIAAIDIARDSFDGDFDRRSWRRLCAAIRLFGTARRIETDRLHGHILALMMGKEHRRRDNSYDKNSAFCRSWTRDHPLLELIEQGPRPAEAEASERASNG